MHDWDLIASYTELGIELRGLNNEVMREFGHFEGVRMLYICSYDLSGCRSDVRKLLAKTSYSGLSVRG